MTTKDKYFCCINSILYEGNWGEDDYDKVLENYGEEYINDMYDELLTRSWENELE